MNPSKVMKNKMGLASKISKHELIQPGALAKGLGRSLKVMSSLNVNAEQRTLIVKNRSYNTATSRLNKLADKNFLVHPHFDEMDDNVLLHQEVEMNQETLTNEARGRGQSLKVKVEKKTLFEKNRSTATTSNSNKSAIKNIPVFHDFYSTEDDDALYLEEEVTQDAHRDYAGSFEYDKAKEVVEVSRDAQRSLFESKKAKKLVEVAKDAMRNKTSSPFEYENAKRMTETTREAERGSFEYDKAKKVVEVSRDAQSLFESKKAKKVVKVAKDTKRNKTSPFESENTKRMTETTLDAERSPFESESAKRITETTQDAERSPFESKKAKNVAEMTQDDQRNPCELETAKKVRGTNICKNVLQLRPGEKLKVTFYQNRVVGQNHTSFTRHLGLLVRDRNMCPLRVHSWMDIEEHQFEHIWAVVTEKFDSDDMNDQRDNVLQHMRKLWNNWRGSLHKNVKSKLLHVVLKDVPMGVDKGDWEWLVKENFLSDKFKEASMRNSINRSKLCMPHRTGSKPIREIVYELGGKDGNPPNMATIFFETRKKGNELVEPETIEKHAEIHELVQSEPSLTNIEVVERCFGPQCKSHVVGFGGGITTKELKGGTISKAALLEKLKTTQKEKESLQKRMDILESKYERLEAMVVRQPSSPSPDEELED